MAWCSLVIAAGCSASSGKPTGSQATSPLGADATVLACQDRAGSAARDDPANTVILDSVALPVRDALQANRSGEQDSRMALFAKSGLYLRVDRAFDVAVADEWRGRVFIGWGSPAVRAGEVRVPGCSAGSPTERWLVYAGGYWLREPACISLVVKAGHRQETIRVGVGAACPGQRPPLPGV